MPKVIRDESKRKVACNVSLPLDFVQMIDSYVDDLKKTFGDQLPKTFSRSDVIRIMVDRFFYTPYKMSNGKICRLTTDSDNMQLTIAVGEEFGLIDSPQLPINFENEIV